LQDNSLSN